MKRYFLVYSISLVFCCYNVQAQWVQINGPNGGAVRFLAVSNMNLFVKASNGAFRSTDNGNSWSSISWPYDNYGPSNLVITSDEYLFATGLGRLYRSTNKGNSWDRADYNFPYPSVTGLFVSGTDIFARYGGDIYLSTSHGVYWSSWSYFNISNILSFVIYQSILVVTPNGVFITKNLGNDWTSTSTGLTNLNVRYITVSGTYLFVGTNNGVFLSTNNGLNWTPASMGLADIDVNTLAVSGAYLFAGTSGGGIWKRLVSEMITSTENSRSLPSHFSIEQNYPNPFNPNTTINYSIPKESFVTIEVYDVLGREVKTIVNENKQVGNYRVEFNASNLVSGIYFYRIQAGNFTETKKLILMK
ncbi:MAG: T9SS type A sorting domain-containing protein [Bacteroidetes bacterium]|nr:T9SS type A sorting domain-containing protein [Bacteroidota bacterium]